MAFDLQGFSYVGWSGPSGFASLGSKIAIDRMAQEGANAIAVAGWSASVAGSTASVVRNDAAELAELGQVLHDAQARGLKVLLKPHIAVADGSSSTSLAPADPAAFFASYKEMLLGYAALAQQYGVAALSIGNEIDSMVTARYLPWWQDIIAAVKSVYTGPITYAATYPRPAEVAFLPQLDYIGVNPYLPLSQAGSPGYQQMVDAWTKPREAGTWQHAAWNGLSYRDYLKDLSVTLGKPVLITEIGYASNANAASDPGNSVPSPVADQALQAELYRALFDVWTPEKSWMKGVFSWVWTPLADPAREDLGWGTGFDTRGKLAEATIRAALGGPLLPPPAIGSGDRVVLTISGDSWNGAPEVVLAANGLIVGKAAVTAAHSLGQWQQVSFDLGLKQDAPNRLQVYFSNDAYGEGLGDRNLYLGSISVNGVTWQGQQGANNVGWSVGTTAVLQANGSVTFEVPAAPGTSPPPPPPPAPVATAPACLFGAPGALGPDPRVEIAPRDYGGTEYLAIRATPDWGTIEVARTAPATWSASHATQLAFDNFVRTELNLAAAGPTGLEVMAVGARNGFVTTGAGDDIITWVAGNGGSGQGNAMTIRAGGGNDEVRITAAGLSTLDGTGDGPLYDAAYRGGSSVAHVDLGAGRGTVTVEGDVRLVLRNGAAEVTARGGNGVDTFHIGTGDAHLRGGAGRDLYVVQPGSGEVYIEDFASRSDRIRFTGVTASEVSRKMAEEAGVSGLLLTYGAEADTIFLAGVTRLAKNDLVFG